MCDIDSVEGSSENPSKKVEKFASFSEFLDSKLNKSVLFKPNNIEVSALLVFFFWNGDSESIGYCFEFEVEICGKGFSFSYFHSYELVKGNHQIN